VTTALGLHTPGGPGRHIPGGNLPSQIPFAGVIEQSAQLL
jgi:hypothetical protein